MFLECPRCFYLDRRLGVARPSIPAFTLNSAVDHLLKKEFDLLRKAGQSHELMKKYGIDAVPFAHAKMDEWRENFVGIQHLHSPTNLLIFGAVDDIWVDPGGNLSVVDYKSTCTEKEISLDDQWKQGYKIQMEVYQWLFRQNGFPVSEVGYFVFANAGKNRPSFDGRLEFELTILSHAGHTDWIEPALQKIKGVLESEIIPKPSAGCEYCFYSKNRLLSVTKASRQT